MRARQAGLGMRGCFWLAVIGVPVCAAFGLWAQGGAHEPDRSRAVRDVPLSSHLPDKPSLPPAFSIPVEPLGFSSPGPIYMGQRNRLVSLDFLDEDHLLFSFRVPALLHRDPSGAYTYERQMRAVALALPSGSVEAEALWTLHDRSRYLWMLKDGHFLLRDRNNLELGDAKLDVKPFLQFPGPLLWLEMDPTGQFLVTDSREPVAAAPKPGQVTSPATASATMSVDGADGGTPDLVVRILRRDTGKVMLVSRVRTVIHLPINADGYVENLRGRGTKWVLNLNFFSGGNRILGSVESACMPPNDFVAPQIVLVSACNPDGGRKLVALDTGGHLLWEHSIAPEAIWPVVTPAPDGSRLARETLIVNHAVSAYQPFSSDDIKGQLVRIFNVADGNVALETRASPVLDDGGNVAISPSGRRVAVLNDGAIQVFELPPPPTLPSADGDPPAR